MNVLAHLHLATLAKSSIIGNVAADFVKGDPYQQYSPYIADGIMMHRRIDKLIDNLPEVKQAKSLFRTEYQRIAPITLDIVWDHFLSKHWQNYYSSEDVATFNQSIKSMIQPEIKRFSDDFVEFMDHLWKGEWLTNYADLNFIARVLNGMANRQPKLSDLRDSFIDIEQNYQSLQELFFEFYPRLMLQAVKKQL